MTTDNFCFYLQNRLIQTSQTGGQQYSDASPLSIPWLITVSQSHTHYVSVRRHNIQHNDTQHDGIALLSITTLSIMLLCRYAESHLY